MKTKKRFVVLTGAGMSAESGLSTFRGAGGLWNNERVEDVATPEAWSSNPQKVLDFYNYRRRELIKAKPNEGHLLLASLEKDYDVRIITQNVDNLHERAGSTHVVHLHGELMKVRSTANDEIVFDVPENNPDIQIGDCAPDGYQLRPHIVWFGEMVPNMELAVNEVEQADILLIIGTSMQVYPAAGLIHYAPKGIPIFLIDPNEVAVSGNYNLKIIHKGASEGIKDFIQILQKQFD